LLHASSSYSRRDIARPGFSSGWQVVAPAGLATMGAMLDAQPGGLDVQTVACPTLPGRRGAGSRGQEIRMSIILGCNAEIYSAFTAAVPGAVGCRSYRNDVICEPGDVPASFPGEPGSRVVASIRPYPDALLSGSLDGALLAMLRDGAARFTAPQLTVWHQAGKRYRDLSFITPAVVRLMHLKMQELCHGVPGVQYGCIICGDIPFMDRWIPYAPDVLDWYGIDVHWNDQFDFRTYDKLKAYLDAFRVQVHRRTGLIHPRINVCETSADDESCRPGFFKNVARWLHHQGGGGRMLASYRDGTPGQPWMTDDTINAFKSIVASYVNPHPGSGRDLSSSWDTPNRIS
jgi:hypothetical protein